MTTAAPTPAVQEPFLFSVLCAKDEEVSVDFYTVPRIAAEKIGEIRIDWGDGDVSVPSLAMTPQDDAELASGEEPSGTVRCTHVFTKYGRRTRLVSLSAPSGFAPLLRLPQQTVSVSGTLPTLTRGETDEAGQLKGLDTLPPLFRPEDSSQKPSLKELCPRLFAANPQLAYFDEAFMGCEIKVIPADLFAASEVLKSLVRTFADSFVNAVPEGLLQNATAQTLCDETFARCRKIKQAERPFGQMKELPLCLTGFMQDVSPNLFGWCGRERRQQAGWVRPEARWYDPSFDFDWNARAHSDEPIVLFYPIDLDFKGDLLVEWGDGAIERIDWNAAEQISHDYENAGIHRVRLHYAKDEPVRPFRPGKAVTAIVSALPPFHPRAAEHVGDFRQWAAGCKELASLPEDLFVHNPSIIHLERAFADCEKLCVVPDAILEPLVNLKKPKGMFDGCTALKEEPASYVDKVHGWLWKLFFGKKSKPKRPETAPSEAAEKASTQGPDKTS